MKKNSLIFGILCLASLAQMRSQTMLQNWLTQSNNAAITNSDDRPYFTHVDANGMIGIVGTSSGKVLLATYDANGNDLWTNKYSLYASDYPTGLEKGPGGNYYVGYAWLGTIRKLGLAGGTSWTVSSSSYSGSTFTVDSNGDVYAVGTDYPQTTIYIDKISSGGNLIWTKTYTGYYGFGGRPQKIKLDHAGNLLLAINAKNGSGDEYLSVAKFDTIGSNPSKIWDNAYTTTKGEVVDFRIDNTTNASYITGAVDIGSFNQRDMIVYKSGPSGVINWSDVYNEANSDDKGCSLEQDGSGNVYVLYDSHNPLTKYSVRKYTSGGSLLTSNGFTYTNYGVYQALPKILIHPTTNQLYLAATRNVSGMDNFMTLYKSNLGLNGFTEIYTYNHDVTGYDFAVDIDVDPTSDNMIFTGNIFKTISGNEYYYAKTDTVGNFIYSNIYNGVINGVDYVSSVVTDAANLPVVARATNSTLTQMDGFMIRYDASGNEQWQAVYGDTLNDYLAAVDVNTSGHFYAGGFTEKGTNNYDMWLIKVDGNGSKLWDMALQGTLAGGHDEVKDVFTDNFNNGYAVGHQTNVGTGQDAAIIKYNSSGNVLWSKKLTGSGNQKDGYMDIGSKNGNIVYAAGYTTKPNGECDMLIAKYDNLGNLQWSRTYNSAQNGNDTAIALNVDANQGIAVVGRSDSAKVITLRYDANGNLLWSATEPTMTAVGPDIITTAGGQTAIVCEKDSGFYNFQTIICYNNAGTMQWFRRYQFSCCEKPMKIAKTSKGTMIIALDFYGQIGAIELDTSGNQRNYVVTNLGLNGDGNFGGTRGLKIDGNGDVYVAAYASPETYTSDFFLQKLCYTPAPATISGNVNVCAQSQGNMYSVATNTTITNYNWASTGGFTINATTFPNGISVDVANSSGYVLLQQSNYCGTSLTDSLYVNVLALPTVSAGADQLVCPNTSITLAGSGGQSYSWSGGVINGVSFTPVVTQAYFVSGTDTNGCSSADTVIIALKQAPAVGLCMVTVDTFSTHNILVWEKAGLTSEVAYFNIYREDITNNYTLIGSVSYDSLSEYHDWDTLMADPNVTTKRYKIAAVDTCGNEGPKSSFHNTIFISHSGGTFTWNTYTIQNQPNPVSNYALYRDDLANGNWQLVGTTAGTQNVLNDPNYATFQATADWRVETVWSISCTSTQRQANGVQATIVKSKSNISNNKTVGIKNNAENNFSVYPNPTNGNLNILVNGTGNGKAVVKLVSMLGQEVYSANVDGTGAHIIDMTLFENGTYMLQVTSENKTNMQRIVKQ